MQNKASFLAYDPESRIPCWDMGGPFVELSQHNPESFLPPTDWLKHGKVSGVDTSRDGVV